MCREPGMPSIRTIFQWLEKNKNFAQLYARARVEQAETYREMIIDEAFSASDAQIGKLRVDALKWVASKLSPRRYGDKVDVEHTGTLDVRVTIGGDSSTTSPLTKS